MRSSPLCIPGQLCPFYLDLASFYWILLAPLNVFLGVAAWLFSPQLRIFFKKKMESSCSTKGQMWSSIKRIHKVMSKNFSLVSLVKMSSGLQCDKLYHINALNEVHLLVPRVIFICTTTMIAMNFIFISASSFHALISKASLYPWGKTWFKELLFVWILYIEGRASLLYSFSYWSFPSLAFQVYMKYIKNQICPKHLSISSS